MRSSGTQAKTHAKSSVHRESPHRFLQDLDGMKPISWESSRCQGDSFLDGFDEIVANVENRTELFHGCRSLAQARAILPARCRKLARIEISLWGKLWDTRLARNHEGGSFMILCEITIVYWLYAISEGERNKGGEDCTKLSLDILLNSSWLFSSILNFYSKNQFFGNKIHFTFSKYFANKRFPFINFILYFTHKEKTVSSKLCVFCIHVSSMHSSVSFVLHSKLISTLN